MAFQLNDGVRHSRDQQLQVNAIHCGAITIPAVRYGAGFAWALPNGEIVTDRARATEIAQRAAAYAAKCEKKMRASRIGRASASR